MYLAQSCLGGGTNCGKGEKEVRGSGGKGGMRAHKDRSHQGPSFLTRVEPRQVDIIWLGELFGCFHLQAETSGNVFVHFSLIYL